jgi:Tol biopolymer transport system component/DNA-binding winged helix-turn-helix (wHTH) protein
MPQVSTNQVIRFGTFEVDLQTEELRKAGLRLKLTGQPFQVLAILLEQPGTVVTREELQKRLWPNTFVDVDHNLNTAINKIREALGDSSENPRFVETLPRRGYRFIASVTVNGTAVPDPAENRPTSGPETARTKRLGALALLAAIVLLGAGSLWIFKRRDIPAAVPQRTLTRITFDEGLQNEPTWSPDGRYIAYSSDRGGKFDIWVQQVSGGGPVQITKGPGHNWQPDWSPDGKYIAYRSEGGGGLFLIPTLGGEGMGRKIASFGYYPRWSPDGSQILFRTHLMTIGMHDRFYVVNLRGSEPREVLADLIPQQNYHTDSAAWYPDGKRISTLLWTSSTSPALWTAPISGGPAVKSEISPKAAQQFADASSGTAELIGAAKFSWAPSGNAIYFDRIYRGARNLWKMSLDPTTLRGLEAERLTIGAGYDVQPTVSADGKKLAFTTEVRHVRTWVFPFDAIHGRLTGPGKAVTSPGLEAWVPNLSRDGSKIVYEGRRNDRRTLWEKSLLDGHEFPIFNDEYVRRNPQWSPDGTRIAYNRYNPTDSEGQIFIWSSLTRDELAVTPPSKLEQFAYDWFPDGKSLLVSQGVAEPHRVEVWTIHVPTVGSESRDAGKKLISDPDHELYQPHISPDGKWIVFEAFKNDPPVESSIYVTSSAGGPVKRISEGDYWDDKPRWSPDGKTIYYVSGREGVFNVWGVHFDAVNGRAAGAPFRVTSFDRPGLAVGDNISAVEFSLVRDKFVLTMEDRDGSIWVLDNVDR